MAQVVRYIYANGKNIQRVLVNGITYFIDERKGIHRDANLDKIYVSYWGHTDSHRYFFVGTDSISNVDAVIEIVCATGTSYNSSTHTLSGNLKFVETALIRNYPSTIIGVPSLNEYCMIGLYIFQWRGSNAPNPLISGTLDVKQGTYSGYKGYISSGGYKLAVTNIPYGEGPIMGQNYESYLLYGGHYSGLPNAYPARQVYPATTWNYLTFDRRWSHIKVTT